MPHAEQVRTKTVSQKTIMGRQAFGLGVADVRKGRPPREDWDIPRGRKTSPIAAAWSYERGRAFAVFCLSELGHLPDIKQGQKITAEALAAYRIAQQVKTII